MTESRNLYAAKVLSMVLKNVNKELEEWGSQSEGWLIFQGLYSILDDVIQDLILTDGEES